MMNRVFKKYNQLKEKRFQTISKLLEPLLCSLKENIIKASCFQLKSNFFLTRSVNFTQAFPFPELSFSPQTSEF